MRNFKWLNLQLFAEGPGDGSEGAGAEGSTGENAVDAEQQRLLELNVPKDKVEQWAKRKAARESRNGTAVPPPKRQVQDATAKEEPTAPTEEEASKDGQKPETVKPSFDELMKDPDYNKAMQDTIKARLKSAKQAEEFASAVAPILAKKYGMEPDTLDMAAIAKAVTNEAAENQDEQNAIEMGVTVDTYRKIQQMQQQEQESIQDRRLRQHAERVIREAEDLKRIIPGFDLMVERANNEVFRRMVDNPDNPVPLETVYKAVHHEEMVQAAVQQAIKQTSQKVANSIQTASRRPEEAGANRQASSVTTFDYSHASKAEREALKARIREAAARGERIYPGM